MDVKSGSSVVNGKLWGSSATDWATIQERTCQPVYEAVFEHVGVGPGMAYADLGCGAGLAAQMAAERGATVTGLDAAQALLEIAQSRSPQGSFMVGELESLPFGDDSFDLVTGFNAFQYAANPGAALSEAKRVAKPGAMVVTMTWGEPAGMGAASLVAALKPLLPMPPPGAPGPFALSEESALRAFAAAAGLETIIILNVDAPWTYADLETALRGLRSSGVAARAVANSSVEAINDAHGKALAPFRQANGSYVIDARFRCLIARA
jgi:SAM-dependent methyltransferase